MNGNGHATVSPAMAEIAAQGRLHRERLNATTKARDAIRCLVAKHLGAPIDHDALIRIVEGIAADLRVEKYAATKAERKANRGR